MKPFYATMSRRSFSLFETILDLAILCSDVMAVLAHTHTYVHDLRALSRVRDAAVNSDASTSNTKARANEIMMNRNSKSKKNSRSSHPKMRRSLRMPRGSQVEPQASASK